MIPLIVNEQRRMIDFLNLRPHRSLDRPLHWSTWRRTACSPAWWNWACEPCKYWFRAHDAVEELDPRANTRPTIDACQVIIERHVLVTRCALEQQRRLCNGREHLTADVGNQQGIGGVILSPNGPGPQIAQKEWPRPAVPDSCAYAVTETLRYPSLVGNRSRPDHRQNHSQTSTRNNVSRATHIS